MTWGSDLPSTTEFPQPNSQVLQSVARIAGRLRPVNGLTGALDLAHLPTFDLDDDGITSDTRDLRHTTTDVLQPEEAELQDLLEDLAYPKEDDVDVVLLTVSDTSQIEVSYGEVIIDWNFETVSHAR